MSKGDEVPDETRLQGVFCTTAHTSGHWRSCLASWDPTSCLGIRFNGKASQTNPLHVLTLTVVLFFCCCYVLMLPKREKTGTEKEKKNVFFSYHFLVMRELFIMLLGSLLRDSSALSQLRISPAMTASQQPAGFYRLR